MKIAATEVATAVNGMVQLMAKQRKSALKSETWRKRGLTTKTGGVVIVSHAETVC